MTADDVRTLPLPYADIAYRESGSGEPILFVHGWPMCSTTWRKVIPALQPSYRCLALDLMGAGNTACDLNQDLGIEAQARMLTDFLDGLEIERVTLVAHDSGATIARAFAIDHPQRVARFVLFDTEVAGHMLPPAVRFLLLLARMPASDRLFRPLLSSRRFRRSRHLGMGNVAHNHEAIDLDDFFATALGPPLSSRDSLRGSLKFIAGFDMSYLEILAPRYDRLTMPKLVIWSERDYFFPPAWGREMFDRLLEPKRFEVIPDCGVFPHEERPADWLALVQPFLEETAV